MRHCVTLRHFHLERYLNDSARFLPAYDIRQSQDHVATLQSEIAAAQARLIPKKKFAFKSRKKKAAAAPAAGGGADGAAANATPTSASASDPPTALTTTRTPAAPAVDLTAISESGAQKAGFSDLSDQTLVLTAADVVGKDLEIKNLKNCKVYIRGQPNILHVKNLTDCQVRTRMVLFVCLFGGRILVGLFVCLVNSRGHRWGAPPPPPLHPSTPPPPCTQDKAPYQCAVEVALYNGRLCADVRHSDDS